MSDEYYKSKESVSEYINMAEGHNGGLLIEKLKNFLPTHASLLEIGSGPGTDWKILKESFNVIGSDFSTEFLKRLMAANPNEIFLELNAVTLATDHTFDGIYSNKVLHHLKDGEIEASIIRQYEILNKDGIICHSFWEGEGSEYFKGLFVNYHSEENLTSLFEKYFELLLLETYQEFESDDSIFLIGRKK